MKVKALFTALVSGSFLLSASVFAIPTLQVGAPASGTTCGPYAAYIGSTTSPTETDTAIISGSTLCVGGIYANGVDLLGGKLTGYNDYSDELASLAALGFDGKGAVLVAAVPDGTLAAALGVLKVNGSLAFGSSATADFFPNGHDPMKTGVSDFLFFDIGNFSNTNNAVPDFADGTGGADGQVMALTLSGLTTLTWVHFDVMALQTDKDKNNTDIITTLERNPGSHDVTWKNGTVPPPTGGDVPEPVTLALLGIGLVGIGFARRRIC